MSLIDALVPSSFVISVLESIFSVFPESVSSFLERSTFSTRPLSWFSALDVLAVAPLEPVLPVDAVPLVLGSLELPVPVPLELPLPVPLVLGSLDGVPLLDAEPLEVDGEELALPEALLGSEDEPVPEDDPVVPEEDPVPELIEPDAVSLVFPLAVLLLPLP
jgi:hypothetical protein